VMYLKWKLSDEGTSGTGPEETIADRGGLAEASWAVDAAGYRIGYLTQTANLDDLDTWDVTEQTEAQAVAFCAALYADAEVLSDGRISGPPPDDDV
jgi:cation diffusion facilitator CzcD-associated flavoprotein CzcO